MSLLVMLQVDVTVVVRHLLGVTVCLQDLFFVAEFSVATPLGWNSMVIIAHRAHSFRVQRNETALFTLLTENGFSLCC